MSNPVPQIAFPPGVPPRRSGPTSSTRLVVMLLLAVLVLGYLLAVFLTRDIWSGREGTRAIFATQSRDGSAPPADSMAEALKEVKARLAERGVSDAEVVAEGNNVVATFPGRDLDSDALRKMFAPAETKTLYIRPVIHAMQVETQPPRTPHSPPPGTDPAQLIADEKQLRQGTDQQIQVLALQFQATRCGNDDALAGHDDPNLPLVTCSADGKTVYLLDKSILTGQDVEKATVGSVRSNGQYIDLQFDDDGARVWKAFTDANIGTQTAFALDTRVISAPVIQEAMPDGHAQIAGNFTTDSARELTHALNRGSSSVSLSLESSADEIVSATTSSKVLRVEMIAGGLVVATVVVGAVVYLARRA